MPNLRVYKEPLLVCVQAVGGVENPTGIASEKILGFARGLAQNASLKSAKS